MATLLYSATASLDGYIAGPDGDMSWLAPHVGGLDADGATVMAHTGALLVGRRTFDGDDPNRDTAAEGAFGGAWDGPVVLLTHRPPAPTPAGVTVATDLDEALAAASRLAGERRVNILGADVARQCLEAGLLDEVLVFWAPVLLGGGTRLFDLAQRPDVRLETVTEPPLTHGRWYRLHRR